MRIKTALILFYVLIAQLVSGQQANDQTATKVAVSDSTVLKPIPLNLVSDKMADAYQLLNSYEEGAQPSKEYAGFDSVYSLRKVQLDREREILALNETEFTSREINDALQEWKSYSKKSSKWIDLFNAQLVEVDDQMNILNELSQKWKVTLDQLRNDNVSLTVVKSVSELLVKIDNLQVFLKKKQDDLASKQNELTALLIEINEVVASLEKEEKVIQSDFFKSNTKPIWYFNDTSTKQIAAKEAFHNSLDRHVKNYRVFYSIYRDKISLHIFIFFLILIGIYFLKKNLPEVVESDDNLYGDAKMFISRVVLSSFIVSLLLSFWLYPITQNAVQDLFQITLLILSVFYLPIGKEKLRPLIILTIFLFLINQVQVFIKGNIVLTRPMLIVETLYATWLLFRFYGVEDFHKKTVIRNRWGFFIKSIPILIIALATSFLTNIIGFTSIALLLTGTVSNSIFNAIIIVLFIRINRSILIVLFHTEYAKKSNLIRNQGKEIQDKILNIIYTIGMIIWIISILNDLTIYNQLLDWAKGIFSLSWTLAGTTIVLGRFFTFFILIIITVYLVKFVKIILEAEVFPRIVLPRGVPGAASMIVGYIISGLGAYLAFTAAGIDLGKFGLIAGALGVGIGFGLQGVVYNFIAGLILSFERPVQVGDTIEIGNMMGDVTSIGVRSSTVKTFDGSEVIVPNGNLISNNLINWTLSDRKKRYDIPVGVAYGTDPHKVLVLLKKIASENENVFKHPEPWALFDGFGDSALNFRIRIWLSVDTGLQTKSDVTVAIYDEFQKADIEIPFPQQDLHFRSVDPDIKEIFTEKKTKNVRKIKTD